MILRRHLTALRDVDTCLLSLLPSPVPAMEPAFAPARRSRAGSWRVRSTRPGSK